MADGIYPGDVVLFGGRAATVVEYQFTERQISPDLMEGRLILSGQWYPGMVPTVEAIPVRPDSPAAALARAVLANPDDRVTICCLMDQVQEWLGEAPNVERERERFTREVAESAAGGDTEIRHGKLDNLLAGKLRDIGYGKAMDIFDAADKWYA